MGRVFIVDLGGQIYSCKHCNTHLTKEQDIMSKSFQGRYGQAYLFNNVVNISIGDKEDRILITGLHTVTDIFCVGCGINVGWKYVTAHDINQKYKEGKSVLELYKIVGPYDSNSNDLVCQEISRLEI
ncbi:Protein yippee-like [Raphanus sativus]|uniref:Protein yippee-like n=1 Tax=Raphanus sativus TaxID=3726 RepID=A0A9W3DRH6_RAPSA|nr:protein yippee-like At3g55890 [Raphanus sativus]KAJ4895932.1 Protein yippee-like [Raphanus sativus]